VVTAMIMMMMSAPAKTYTCNAKQGKNNAQRGSSHVGASHWRAPPDFEEKSISHYKNFDSINDAVFDFDLNLNFSASFRIDRSFYETQRDRFN
jgi:hypothetical protein